MEESEFDRIWLPHRDAFYRVAFWCLEDEDEAQDAVQDLYIKLWRTRESLDGIENPHAYGVRIIKNLCIDRIRAGSRHRTSSLDDVNVVSADNPEARIFGRQDLETVRKAIDKLPAKQRKLIEMRVFREMDYDKMSRQTGLTKLNIRVTLSQARKHIEAILKTTE